MSDPPENGTASEIKRLVKRFAEINESRPSHKFAEERSAKGSQTIVAILTAAREVFAREGHAGLTMRMVAEETGIAAGNISYYFPSKRELLEAMLREELVNYIEEHIRQIENKIASPLEILLDIVEFYVGNSRSSYQFFYQLWGYAGSSRAAMALISELYRPVGRIIFHLIRLAKPELDYVDVRKLVLQIVSLLEGVRICIGLGPDDDIALRSVQKDVRELTRKIIELA